MQQGKLSRNIALFSYLCNNKPCERKEPNDKKLHSGKLVGVGTNRSGEPKCDNDNYNAIKRIFYSN
jgi:hypothetical protein